MDMQRREFIGLIGGREFIGLIGGGAAIALPLAVRAQQDSHIKLVGVLSGSADTADQQARVGVFRQALLQLGWSEGRNVRFDIRWGGGDPDTIRKQAASFWPPAVRLWQRCSK